ncbi:MAG: hypothetical protein ACREMR_06595 [Gemmatimonadales bacterium]
MSREVSRQLEQLAEHIERHGLHVPPVLVRVLTGLASCPSWARDLGDGRCCYTVGADAEQTEAVFAALLAGEPLPEGAAVMEYKPTLSRFLRAVAEGADQEHALVGARGTHKTTGGLDAMALYAKLHHAAGGALPLRVGIIGSTAVQLRSALRVMEAPWWGGCWRLEDDDRRAKLVVGGVTWVDADLLGVEDQGQGSDRLRRRWHLVMGDDPAPALGEMSTGFTEASWATALTSRDLPTPLDRRPAIVCMNAGTRVHWSTRRFITAPVAGCAVFRIPTDEALTPAQQDELRRSLTNHPDLLARLLHGEVADPMLGLPVAQGYSDQQHVAAAPLEPVRGALWCGWDAGLTPVCIIAQVRDGVLRVYAALATERGGTRDFIEGVVQPWLVQHMPWALRNGVDITHCCDPAMTAASQEDSTKAPASTVRALLGCAVRLGPVRWAQRRDPLLALFNRAVAGRPALHIAPTEDTELLRRALAGMWIYGADASGGLRPAEQPIKSHPWSDLGDALTYLVAELFPTTGRSWERAKAEATPTRFAKGSLSRDWRGDSRRAAGPLSRIE